jgi:hypothetical protein
MFRHHVEDVVWPKSTEDPILPSLAPTTSGPNLKGFFYPDEFQKSVATLHGLDGGSHHGGYKWL